MKRARETHYEEDSPFGVLGDAFGDAFLGYILSFAWKSVYSLSLVCKHFYRLTSKSRTFWRQVALRVYHGKIPKDVLEQVDFFHGLSEEDPPWSYLWNLYVGGTNNRCTWGAVASNGNLYLRHYKEGEFGFRNVLRLHFVNQKGKWWYSLSRSIRNDSAVHKTGSRICIVYIGHPFLKKRTYVNTLHVHNTYVEIWDPARQQTWYGEPGKMMGMITSSDHYTELYPNKESFGVWL